MAKFSWLLTSPRRSTSWRSLDSARRKLVVTTSPTKRSADFIDHLRLLDRLYGPKPGAAFRPVVVVLDGPIHISKATLAALAARVRWLTVEWLPKYSAELNEIETVWRDLKVHHLAHQTFTDAPRARPGHPQRRHRSQPRANPQSVGHAKNLCLASRRNRWL